MSATSQKPQEPPAELVAVVGKVRDDGKGKFVVTYPEVLVPPFNEGEDITFSISDWTGRLDPRQGERVILREIRSFWRLVLVPASTSRTDERCVRGTKAKGWPHPSASRIFLKPGALRDVLCELSSSFSIFSLKRNKLSTSCLF